MSITREHVVAAELSLGRYFWDTHVYPPIGSLWKVDAEVIDAKESSQSPAFRELQFEITVSEDLVVAAQSLVEFAKTAFPVVWTARSGDLIDSLRPRMRFETMNDSLRGLSSYLNDLLDTLSNPIDGSWISQYLSRYWRPLISPHESRSYYRGQAHGLRIALDYFKEHVCLVITEDMFRDLLHVVLGAFGAECAAYYFDEVRNECDVHLMSDKIIPKHIVEDHSRRYAGLREAILSYSPSATEKNSLLLWDEAPDVSNALERFVPEGEDRTFYAGLCRGLHMSICTMLFLQEKIAHSGWMEDCSEILMYCRIAAEKKGGFCALSQGKNSGETRIR